MSVAIVTGSGGLVGSAVVRRLSDRGFEVVGIDNDMRGRFFGQDGSVGGNIQRLRRDLGGGYSHRSADIRDVVTLSKIFTKYASSIGLVVHAAAQPAHDWADRHPVADFEINAMGTVNLLSVTRQACPGATFVYLSTIKVYGPHPNALPLAEGITRFDLPSTHRYYVGIDETMSIDGGPLRGGGQGWGPHSMFGASKTAADLMVQEFGHSYGMNTVVLRPGCLTGGYHAAAEAHGFLAYLMRCAMEGRTYKIYGYDGKQVRDQLHVADVADAVERIQAAPPPPGSVFNLGGGRSRAISIVEAIDMISERLVDSDISVEQAPAPRRGDHRWWITDSGAFSVRYGWEPRYDVYDMAREIYEINRTRWCRP